MKPTFYFKFILLIFLTVCNKNLSAQACGNLLVNPVGEFPVTTGWSVLQVSGTSPGFGQLVGSGFATTHGPCGGYGMNKKAQLIDLLARGFSADFLDLSPAITIQETFSTAWTNAICTYPSGNSLDLYYIRAELQDENHNVIATVNWGTEGSPLYAPVEGITHSHTFSGYPSGVRYIYFEDGGLDVGWWDGYYGTFMQNAMIQFDGYVCPEITQCPQDSTLAHAPDSCGAIVDYQVPTATGMINQVFNYTGAMQEWIVPEGVTSIIINSWGAQGGDGGVSNAPGAPGGYASGSLTVTPGQTLFIYVGGKGSSQTTSFSGAGGFNGGGSAGSGFYGSGGGGASDIRTGGTALADRIIVAGGGGGKGSGAGDGIDGGLGGGLTGGTGSSAGGPTGGGGGTQISGGAGGTGTAANDGFPGALGLGGSGGAGGVDSGGGGGGGYYGGGGGESGIPGANSGGGGGGGSSYIGGVSNSHTITGIRTGHGQISILYQGTLTPQLESGLPSGDFFPVGTTEIIYEVTDFLGNTAICSFNITVTDTPPAVECFNITVTFDGDTNYTLQAAELVEASDICGIADIAFSPSVISCAQVGQTQTVLVTVTDLNDNISTCTSQVTVEGLPCEWSQSPDGIGCPGGNDISYNPNTQVFTATSTNCFYASPYTSDAMAFTQQTLCGNGSITAQVTSISGNSFGWAGVTMRESNAPGAKKVQLSTNLNSNLNRREVRTVTNGQAFPQQFPAQNRFWLRIVRTGNQFVAYSSPNGVNWFPVMSANVSMNSCIEVGLVLTNYTPGSTVNATFANVSVVGGNATLPSFDDNLAVSGINENLQNFEVYPNPTNGELYIDMPSYAGKSVRIELYNLQGQLLQFIERDEIASDQKEQISLIGYAPGMYFVKLKSSGLQAVTKRIVLQVNQLRP